MYVIWLNNTVTIQVYNFIKPCGIYKNCTNRHIFQKEKKKKNIFFDDWGNLVSSHIFDWTRNIYLTVSS